MRVNEDLEANKQLSSKDRISNIESDIVDQRSVLKKLVRQNDQYKEYLDVEIQAKKSRDNFWRDVRKRLAVKGIVGMVLIILSALAYGVKYWLSTH